jgi:mannose-1-phosphate guanylyltransferase/mannose-6-phosphate isomerase
MAPDKEGEFFEGIKGPYIDGLARGKVKYTLQKVIKMETSGKKKGGLYGVILAGGIGSRFWPLSRETTPKQLLKVVGEQSLLKSTIARLSPLITPERTYIVTSLRQAELIRLHLSYGGKALSPNYVLEPAGRNTAPAIGLAAVELVKKDPEAVMAVLPADHLIGDGRAFRRTLKAASKVSEEGHLVTFGVVPTRPETGYGYIKAGPTVRGSIKRFNGLRVRPVRRFVEKPNLKRARGFLKEGGYYWNSGMFVWKARRILEEMSINLPRVHKRLMAIRDGSDIDNAYGDMEAISIDHGVLEKANDVFVIEAGFPWSDIGSWGSLKEVLKADRRGNIIRGRVVDIGSEGSVILASGRVVATIGLSDTILVDTPDATLVCPTERAQEVKDIVGILKKKGFPEHEEHLTVERPWGSYTVLEKGAGYKTKKIRIEPERRLSLQMHRKRSEHWVVITGEAKVQRGDEVVLVRTNESTYIPRGVKHRLENPSKHTPLEIIEVQSGGYVEEDDIERFDDDYERG